MTTLQSVSQSLQPSARISLFSIDLAPVGGSKLYFVQNTETGGAPVSFNGIEYTAIDIEFAGLTTSGVAALPTPTFKLANTAGLPQSLVNSMGDLLGCPVTRLRTYARFLDGHEEPDGDAFYGPDIFSVERKVSENPLSIQWELSAAIDQAGKKLPGRIVIRDTCMWRYREWNPTSLGFDYSKAQCPYTGTQSYDINDAPTADPSADAPSRNLSCCRARFGRPNPLPFGGFPGAERVSG